MGKGQKRRWPGQETGELALVHHHLLPEVGERKGVRGERAHNYGFERMSAGVASHPGSVKKV